MNPLAPRQVLLFIIIVVAIGVALPCASAATLTIANPGFESPTFADAAFNGPSITLAQQGGYGWSFSDASGIFNPPAIDYTGAGGSGTPAGADGSQVSYSVQRYAVFQILAGTDGIVGNADDPLLSQLTTYTLTLSIGQRLPGNQYGGAYGGYRFELLAGLGLAATVIAQETDVITPPPGTFVDRTISVDSATLGPAFANLFGQPLTIRMASTGIPGNAVIDFDNVRLDSVISPLMQGDVNLNRHVNADDIATMLAALADVNKYQSDRGLTDAQLFTIVDLNNSGAVNNADVQALINQLLSGGGSAAVPEPATAILFALAIPVLLRAGRRRR